MKAPAQPSDISKEWIQYMLTDFESQEKSGTTVTVDTYEISEGCKVGEGFVGSLVKLHVKAKLSKHSVSIDPESDIIYVYNLVIKLKGEDPRIQFMFENAQFYLKEALMYSKVLNEFDNFQRNQANNQYPISIPKFVYGKCTADEFVLVMENIEEKGFFIHNKEDTFNFQHIKLAVTQLVRLHAVSYSCNQSFSFLERHPEFEITDYIRLFHRFLVSAIIDIVCEILKEEKDEDLANKIKTNKENILKQYLEMLDENKYKLLCLVHGDVHARNMMFRYNEGDEKCENPNGIKMLDWQLPVWNIPVMDLHSLIYTSTSREFRKEHLEDILQFYHSSFTETTSTMGVVGLNLTYEDFKNDFNSMALYGFIRGIHLTFMHHCPEFVKLNEDDKQKAINQSYFLKTLLTPVAKLFQYFFFSSAVDSVMNYAFKASLLPFIKTITTRENENLASRILGLIYEAEDNGLFG